MKKRLIKKHQCILLDSIKHAFLLVIATIKKEYYLFPHFEDRKPRLILPVGLRNNLKMREFAIFRDDESNFCLKDKNEERAIFMKISVIFEQK